MKGKIVKAQNKTKQKNTGWGRAKRQKVELKAKHGVKCRIPQKLGMLKKKARSTEGTGYTPETAENRARNIQEGQKL